MIEVDCRKCINCTGNECILFGKDADVATNKCAADNFKNYVTFREMGKVENPKKISTRIGFLRRGDYFFFEGTKYKISHLLENSYVSCINVATGKKERFYIDTDIEVEH